MNSFAHAINSNSFSVCIEADFALLLTLFESLLKVNLSGLRQSWMVLLMMPTPNWGQS